MGLGSCCGFILIRQYIEFDVQIWTFYVSGQMKNVEASAKEKKKSNCIHSEKESFSAMTTLQVCLYLIVLKVRCFLN